MQPIIDLHCDLLNYLALDPKRGPFDPAPRCSYPQLKAGNVQLQTLAIFTETAPGSQKLGWKQVEAFHNLLKSHPQSFSFYKGAFEQTINIVPAIENASGFCGEDETLKEGTDRLQLLIKKIGRPLYIGLTWNGENRFGGGIGSPAGLKKDGLELLKWLQGKNIAIDLSHASLKLCEEIINAIDKYSLQLRIMASHCNFRKVLDHPRNLTDDVAKEIFYRKGIIGLVFYKKFVHPEDPKALLNHIEHGLKLGGKDSLCFGADFFSLEDPFIQPLEIAGFFDELSDSSKYSYVIKLMETAFDREQIAKIARQNALHFFSSLCYN